MKNAPDGRYPPMSREIEEIWEIWGHGVHFDTGKIGVLLIFCICILYVFILKLYKYENMECILIWR